MYDQKAAMSAAAAKQLKSHHRTADSFSLLSTAFLANKTRTSYQSANP